MEELKIKQLLQTNGIQGAVSIRKIDVGFTNTVFNIDNKYIIKICRLESNEPFFKREAQLYQFFKTALPVPQLLTYDDSKSVIDSHYMIYPIIEGDNLYNVWHELSVDQRKSITKQLCSILKKINQTDVTSLPKTINIGNASSWKEKILEKLNMHLSLVQTAGTLSESEVAQIRKYVESNQGTLDQEKMALVYWDAHFDNIIVKNDKIVGLLDFERTEIASIDFALDLVQRMVDVPKKYMSEHAEQFARDEDYAHLMEWYREYYPELFDFEDIAIRINLYSITHDLEDLEGWPDVQSLKDNVLRITA
jgi:aminoglycoside phosphotransferase (APT) family kinase protein